VVCPAQKPKNEEDQVMYIERTTVGSVTIDGKTYEHDVVIRLSGEGAQITAELPGMEENDIEVNVSDDVLTIKGEKKEPKKSTMSQSVTIAHFTVLSTSRTALMRIRSRQVSRTDFSR
jgi:HSP20 family molecular chaperone IbpA